MIVTGAHVVTPSGIMERNIVINHEKISAITTDEPQCDQKIRANGLVAIPGAIDPHVHYGVYSPIDQAAETESHAAAIGGVTTMMRMLRLGGSYQKLLDEQLKASREKSSRRLHVRSHACIFHARVDPYEICILAWRHNIRSERQGIKYAKIIFIC